MAELIKLAAARQLFDQYGAASQLLLHPTQPATSSAGAAIYICDVRTSRTLLLETAQSGVNHLYERAMPSESKLAALREAFAILLDDLLTSIPEIHPETRRGVIFGSAFFVMATRGFTLTRHHGQGVQYLLIRYPDDVRKRDVLTVMPVFKTHPIPAAELEATVNHILLSERLNFPDRFTEGVDIRFKQLRRNVLSAQ